MNGCGSFRLGYVGVGFGGNCDCRYGILYAPILGGGFCRFRYSGIFSLFFALLYIPSFSHIYSCVLTEIYPTL